MGLLNEMIRLKKAIGPERVSRNLVVGEWYKITAHTEQDFTADGAPDNDVGTYFKAIDTNAI